MNYYNTTWINEMLIIFNYNLKSYFQNESYILITVVLSNGQKLFSFLCLFQDMLKSWVLCNKCLQIFKCILFFHSVYLCLSLSLSLYFIFEQLVIFVFLNNNLVIIVISTDREKRNGMEWFFSFLKRFLWTWKISAFFCVKEFF